MTARTTRTRTGLSAAMIGFAARTTTVSAKETGRTTVDNHGGGPTLTLKKGPFDLRRVWPGLSLSEAPAEYPGLRSGSAPATLPLEPAIDSLALLPCPGTRRG